MSGDHKNYCITDIDQNTEKSSWRLEEICSYSNSCEKASAIAGEKIFRKSKIISAGTPDLIIISKKKKKKKEKKTCRIIAFSVPTDHRIKLKECKKKDKYCDLARELKKLWNMQVTIIPIVIGAFKTVTKGLLKGLENLEFDGWMETIQTSTLLRTARILRRVLETWGDLLSFKLQWKTIS